MNDGIGHSGDSVALNFLVNFFANRIYLFFSPVRPFSVWSLPIKFRTPTHTHTHIYLCAPLALSQSDTHHTGKRKIKGKKKKKVCSRPPSPVYVEVQVTIRRI